MGCEVVGRREKAGGEGWGREAGSESRVGGTGRGEKVLVVRAGLGGSTPGG